MMKVPSYVRVSEPYWEDGKMYSNVTVKWWGVFVITWQTLTEEYEIPWYGWPKAIMVWLRACLMILRERKP